MFVQLNRFLGERRPDNPVGPRLEKNLGRPHVQEVIRGGVHRRIHAAGDLAAGDDQFGRDGNAAGRRFEPPDWRRQRQKRNPKRQEPHVSFHSVRILSSLFISSN